MLYYSNGGPGPATKLLRVDAPDDGSYEQWLRAPAARWQPLGGWRPDTNVQMDIQQLGEFFMIEPEAMPVVQQQIRDGAAKYG